MFPFFGFPRRAANLGISMTGAVVLPLFAVSGQAQIGRDMTGTVNLKPLTAAGSATVSAQPTITITSPANADSYTFAGADSTTEAMSVSGTAGAGSSGSISSVTYSVTGATSQSGTATGTTSWSFSISSLAYGVSTVTVTANHSNGNTKSDTITINRTPAVKVLSNYYQSSTPKEFGTCGWTRGYSSTTVSYVVKKDGVTQESGNCTTGTGTITKPWGGTFTPTSGTLGWTTPKLACNSAGQWRIYITATNAAGSTTIEAYGVNS